MIPGLPSDRAFAETASTWSTDGISLWAEDASGIRWSASKSVALGLVHSNDDLVLTGSNNELTGGVEYVADARIRHRGNLVDPPPIEIAASASPLEHDIADYQPGGAAAVAAGDLYHDATDECALTGTWRRHSSGTEILTGLHYVPCDVDISASEITGSFTLVAEGTIDVAGSRLTLGPAFVDDLLFLSGSDADKAIRLAGAKSDFDGVIAAHDGGVTIAGSNHDLRCPVIADDIWVTGSKHRFDGDHPCGLEYRNHAPVALDDAYETGEDTALSIAAPGVLANDTDPDGDTLWTALAAAPDHGTVTLGPDGSFDYVPDADFHGTDAFTYEVCDGDPLCDLATVTLSVSPVNDPPFADPNGPYTAIVGETVTFDGSGSVDPDGSIVGFDWDFGDGGTGTGVAPVHTYATAGDFTVALTVTDDGGATGTDVTIAQIGEPANTPPTAFGDAYALDEDTVLSVTAPGVLANDIDGEDDPLTATAVTGAANGTVTLAADGSFTYEPAANWSGDDSFTYVADDGLLDSGAATVTLTVRPVNDPPVADAGADQLATVGDLVTFDGSGSSDPVEGDTLTYAWLLQSRPTGSTAALSDSAGVAPTFTPDLPGTYIVELTVDDGNGGTDTDTAVVTTDRIGITITLTDSLVGVGRTTDGRVTLDQLAPAGGVTIDLALDTTIATVDPAAVSIPGGGTEGTFVVTGVAVGTTTITGTSPVTATATADVEVTDFLISIDDIPVLAPDETADLPVSITKPAPPGGLTISLESLDPTIAITDATAFVPEGLQVPTANPQITGVDFGTTQIRASAPGFAPDVRDVTVALTVALTPTELDLPELWTLQVSAQLSAPAPSGGVTLDLTLDDPALATIQPTAFIPAGQTLTGPIDITGTTTLGTTTLRAGGPGLVEGTATINVIDQPDVYLATRASSSWVYRDPFVVGYDLQDGARVRFEVLPPEPVDVVVSVPAGSGVLLSASPTEAGSESLVVDTAVTGRLVTSTTFYVQGLIEGDNVDDDVVVTIDVYATGSTTPVGYEQADRPSNIDVGPSGFFFTSGVDLDAPTFPDSEILVVSWLLYDGETARSIYSRRDHQQVRGGHSVTIDPTNTSPAVGEVVGPAVFSGATDPEVALVFDGLVPGVTTLEIVQPAGHSLATNLSAIRNVNVTAPDVWLATAGGSGTWPYFDPYVVGYQLQDVARVQFEVLPPEPVDVIVSVPAGSGVLLSASPTEAGSESLVVGTAVTGIRIPTSFYVQGLIEGDNVDDDVPVTIDVYATGTTNAIGYEQADRPSNIDVGPSGFFFGSGADLDAPTFPDTEIVIVSWVLYDGETDRSIYSRRDHQQVRGGHTVTIDPTTTNPGVGEVVTPAVFSGATDPEVALVFDGLVPGVTTLEIVQPAGHSLATNLSAIRNVNVTAPDVWLATRASSSWVYRDPFVVGYDLQDGARVRFEVLPPEPVDVVVSVPAGSGVLLSASPTEAGSESLVVDTAVTGRLVTSTTFYVQGLIEGDNVDDDVVVTIDVYATGSTTPVGYEQADRPSNIDVGPSGFAFPTSSDLDTTTFSPDEIVIVVAYLLHDGEAGTLHTARGSQQVRGGHSVTIDPTNTSPTVGEVVSPAVCAGGAPLLYPFAHCGQAVFDPLTAGTTTLGIDQPIGHVDPADKYVARDVNVDAPDLVLERRQGSSWLPRPDERIGLDLQVERRIGLEVAPPAPGVDVTIEIADPTVALVSTDPTAVGTASITFPLVTGEFTPLIYVQGLALNQGTELRITAPGYDQWITTVQVVDAGFQLATNDFTTTADASNRTVRVRPVSLDALQQVDEVQPVRGGTTPSVEVTSSDPSVGVITVSPLVFTGSDAYLDTEFDPLAVGSTTISITQPPGFLPPAGEISLVATVS